MKLEPTYVKKYPDMSPESIRKAIEEMSNKRPNPHIKRAVSKMTSRMRTVPKENAKEIVEELIEKSKQFCDKYCIDIEIFDLKESVLIKMYMLSHLYGGEQKSDLMELISIADDFTIETFDCGEFDYTFSLLFYGGKIVFDYDE